MRSRTSQARALFRILTAQSASGSSAAATTSASASASASSSATATSASQTARSSTAFKRRRNVGEGRSSSKNDGFRTVYIRASVPPASAAQMVVSGLQPVHPPPASIASVATQAFFASGRPLLEHGVLSPEPPSKSFSQEQEPSSDSEEQLSKEVKATIENARDAIMEAASRASRLSPEELSRTMFVVTGVPESGQDGVWAKRIANLDHDRFVKLVDRLSQAENGLFTIQAEAKALEAEQEHRKDVQSAIANALERGEDPRVAKSLGSEADLVVLGEPKGPNPEWPRGVASFLVESTRALEPPPAPAEQSEAHLAESLDKMDIQDLAKFFTGSENAFTVQTVREDDANLLLSHAMVQAILPPQLRWDATVEKMDEAGGVTQSDPSQVVDWSAINADWEPTEKVDTNEVKMDSVKRKRRKKMRKHKYRKFRKATRVERQRLKK